MFEILFKQVLSGLAKPEVEQATVSLHRVEWASAETLEDAERDTGLPHVEIELTFEPAAKQAQIAWMPQRCAIMGPAG